MKAKNIFAILICIVACAATTYAQNSTPGRNYLGLRAAFEMTTSTKMTEYCGYRPGGSIGVVYHGNFGRNFFFEGGPEIFFSSISLDKHDNSSTPISGQVSGHMNDFGLRLPIDFGYQVPVSSKVTLLAYTGPTLCFNIKTEGKFLWLNQSGAAAEKMSKLHNTGLDIAWNFAIGADLCSRWRIAAECIYGLTDLCSMDYFKLSHGKNHAYFRASPSDSA